MSNEVERSERDRRRRVPCLDALDPRATERAGEPEARVRVVLDEERDRARRRVHALLDRQREAEGRGPSRHLGTSDVAVHRARERPRDREAQAEAAVLGRLERMKERAIGARRDARAVVAHGERELLGALVEANADVPALVATTERVEAVADQVLEDDAHEGRLRPDRAWSVAFETQLDAALARHRRQVANDQLGDVRDRRGATAPPLRARERTQGIERDERALHLGAEPPAQIGHGLGVGRRRRVELVDEQPDGVERVLQLVQRRGSDDPHRLIALDVLDACAQLLRSRLLLARDARPEAQVVDRHAEERAHDDRDDVVDDVVQGDEGAGRDALAVEVVHRRVQHRVGDPAERPEEHPAQRPNPSLSSGKSHAQI